LLLRARGGMCTVQLPKGWAGSTYEKTVPRDAWERFMCMWGLVVISWFLSRGRKGEGEGMIGEESAGYQP
jgi:hypothetical protein